MDYINKRDEFNAYIKKHDKETEDRKEAKKKAEEAKYKADWLKGLKEQKEAILKE